MSADQDAELEQAAVEAVREASRAGRLAFLDDIWAALAARDAGAPTPDEAATARLAAVLSVHPCIASFESLSGQSAYHAPDLLSRTYARILDRKGSPAALMAGEVRVNSRDYPRPVPLELFEAPPFGLAPETIQETLRAMAADPDCRDITFTTTPSGAVYLFSTRHLERGYAAFLAERTESLAMNP